MSQQLDMVGIRPHRGNGIHGEIAVSGRAVISGKVRALPIQIVSGLSTRISHFQHLSKPISSYFSAINIYQQFSDRDYCICDVSLSQPAHRHHFCAI